MRTRLALTGLALVVPLALAGLAGCGSDSEDTAEPTSPFPTFGDAAASIELLDAGAAPSRVLQPMLREGSVQRVVFTTRIELTTNGQSVPTPEISLPMTSEVLSADPDGTTVRQTFGAPRLPRGTDPVVLAGVENSLQGVDGAGLTLDLGPDLQLVEATPDLPYNATPALRQFLENVADQAAQLTAPFPDEAVGEGARWRVQQQLEVNGLRIDQTATYVLRSLDGAEYVLATRLEQRYEPGGTSAFTVSEGSGSGEGKVTGSLDQALPTSSRVRAVSRLVGEASGQPVTVETTTHVSVRAR